MTSERKENRIGGLGSLLIFVRRESVRSYLYLRFLAASDFFFLLTLGFSYASLLRSSAWMPERWHCLLKRFSALSRDSPSFTLTSATLYPSLRFQQRQQTRLPLCYYTRTGSFCQVFSGNSCGFCDLFRDDVDDLAGDVDLLDDLLPREQPGDLLVGLGHRDRVFLRNVLRDEDRALQLA